MAVKRKISIRKILQAFVTLLVTSACVVAVVSASGIQKSRKLNGIHLAITNEGEQQFLDKEAIWRELVERRALKEKATPLDSLDIAAVERAAYRNPWVAGAQVYLDKQREIHIDLVQRVPVARVFLENGGSYYLDASLKLLPLSELFTYYTVIVTNVPATKNESLNKKMYASIIALVKQIEHDSFWNAQIAQVIVTPELEFELVPVLGKHKILFGDTSRMVKKFSHLFAFYRNVLNRIGWDKYELIDLRYKNQLVASPALPWKPATKNGLSNMDWLKSIMGEAPIETANAATAPSAMKLPVADIPKPAEPKKATINQDRLPEAGSAVGKGERQGRESSESSDSPPAKYIYQGTNQ